MPASTTVRLLCPLAFLALLGQSYVQAQDYGNDTTALLASGVVPVAAPAVSEEALLTVIYQGTPLIAGSHLSVSSVKQQPDVALETSIESNLTLIVVDPDAPTPQDPSSRFILHWLITNIADQDVLGGDIVAPYKSPSPPPGSDAHRYIFLLYQQSQALTVTIASSARTGFSLPEFVSEQGLGEPIAATFFYAAAATAPAAAPSK